MKQFFLGLLTGFIFVSCYVGAESFVKNRPVKKSSSQLKEEIIQTLTNLVKLESKTAEINAQIQNKLFNQIELLVENSRSCWFNKSNTEKLQEYNNKLIVEQKESELRLESLNDFNKYISENIK